MNYDIYAAQFAPGATVKEYSVEIQPPLTSLAVEGLIKRLTTKSEREYNYRVVAEDVSVVRQDETGTALVVILAEDIYLDTEAVGNEVAFQLNPCDLPSTQITTHTVAGRYGLPE